MKFKVEYADKINEFNDQYEKFKNEKEIWETQKKIEMEKIKQMSKGEEKSLLDQYMGTNFLGSTSLIPKIEKKVLDAHKGGANFISYNTTGTLVVSGGSDNLVKVWDPKTWTSPTILTYAQKEILSAKISDDTEFICGSSHDNSVYVWKVKIGRLAHTLNGHSNKVFCASFTADSQQIVSGSHDRTIKIWDLKKGYCSKTISCISSCNDLAVTTDGTTIVSGHVDNKIRFWDKRKGSDPEAEITQHQGSVTSVSISHDGFYVLSNSRDDTLKKFQILENMML